MKHDFLLGFWVGETGMFGVVLGGIRTADIAWESTMGAWTRFWIERGRASRPGSGLDPWMHINSIGGCRRRVMVGL